VENVNHPPTANAGTDQTKVAGSIVTLDGSASTDPDGDPLTFLWCQVSGPSVALSDPSSPTPSFTAPATGWGGAVLVFRLVVSDGVANSTPDTVSIQDLHLDAPPVCSAAMPSQAVLWPPNHRLVSIRIMGVTDPDSTSVTITVTSVTQDEPVNGLGDGDTGPDAVLQGSTVLIRAERSGSGNGRVYTIHFVASDGQGGSCTGSVQVLVPHDQGHGGIAVDDGQQYTST
jgi:hypothetical protein